MGTRSVRGATRVITGDRNPRAPETRLEIRSSGANILVSPPMRHLARCRRSIRARLSCVVTLYDDFGDETWFTERRVTSGLGATATTHRRGVRLFGERLPRHGLLSFALQSAGCRA